jgi:hypothetical protein
MFVIIQESPDKAPSMVVGDQALPPVEVGYQLLK